MNNLINKIMSKIPSDWTVIPKEEYALRKVYVSDAYQIIEAYDVKGQLLVINHYPDVEGFITAYDEQFKEIKEVIKGKDWKQISVLNPLKNAYLKNKPNEKLYICVFETYNVDEKVTVQIFCQDENHTIGVSTFINKNDKEDVLTTVKKDATINLILSFFKNT